MTKIPKFAAGFVLALVVVSAVAATNLIENLKLKGNADAAGFQIDNLGSPTNAAHAATMGWTTNLVTTTGTNYATAAQGLLADSALQTGASYTNISGLGTAATNATADFATAAQGSTADSAVQPGDLAAVATSGDYGDLNDLPTLGTAAAEDVGFFATAAQGGLADSALQPGETRADLSGGSGTLDLSIYTLTLPADVTRLGSSIDLSGGEVTGTLPGASVQISGTGNAGAVTLATDAEIQTGTDTAKVVRVSGLAAFWAWAKTQAQTIAGNWTFSGTTTHNVVSSTTATITTGTLATLSVTGNTTLGDASGDSVTVNAGTVTAPNATSTSSPNNLINLGVQDLRYFAGNPLNLSRGFWDIPTGGGTVNVGGSGSGTPNANSFRISTGATASSWVMWRPNSNQLVRFSKGNSGAGVDFSRPTWLLWSGQIDIRSNGIFRVQLGQLSSSTTIADLAPAANTHGLGFLLSAGDIKLETTNTSVRTLSSSLGAYSTAGAFYVSLAARSDGTGNVRVWINGTEVAAQSGGPTLGTSASYNGLHVSVENGADSASRLADMCASQIYVILE